MDRIVFRLLQGVLVCSLTAALVPALHAQDRPNAQDNQESRPAAGAKPEHENRSAPANRPAGHAQTQAPAQTRSPGNHPQEARPQPTRPEPAARPQPRHTQPVRPEPATRPAQNEPQQNRHQAQRPAQERPEQNRQPAQRPAHSRPPQWGRPPARHPSYSFRSSDRGRLRGYYASRMGEIDRANRPRIVVGGYYPYEYIDYLQPVPRMCTAMCHRLRRVTRWDTTTVTL